MEITREDVLKVAELARLSFAPEELDAFTSQFQHILGYIEKLKLVDIEGVLPTSHVACALGDEQRLREDEIVPSLAAEEALMNAPDQGDGHFLVPKVIGGEE